MHPRDMKIVGLRQLHARVGSPIFAFMARRRPPSTVHGSRAILRTSGDAAIQGVALAQVLVENVVPILCQHRRSEAASVYPTYFGQGGLVAGFTQACPN